MRASRAAGLLLLTAACSGLVQPPSGDGGIDASPEASAPDATVADASSEGGVDATVVDVTVVDATVVDATVVDVTVDVSVPDSGTVDASPDSAIDGAVVDATVLDASPDGSVQDGSVQDGSVQDGSVIDSGVLGMCNGGPAHTGVTSPNNQPGVLVYSQRYWSFNFCYRTRVVCENGEYKEGYFGGSGACVANWKQLIPLTPSALATLKGLVTIALASQAGYTTKYALNTTPTRYGDDADLYIYGPNQPHVKLDHWHTDTSLGPPPDGEWVWDWSNEGAAITIRNYSVFGNYAPTPP